MLINLLLAFMFVLVISVAIVKFDLFFNFLFTVFKQTSIFARKLKFLIETMSRAYFRYKRYTLSNSSKFSL
jgi:hypothetical protein